ncbi:hypothetical protein [Thiohalocapsa sp. ML1]|uniref:hypothetical protein n=1 Tax=Thiohalocapsa sp. ML1 TaxID=1431688 RepID=UPI0012E3CCB7|nr:hypothetical protein [Thiohalocapsa sp. ML1]
MSSNIRFRQRMATTPGAAPMVDTSRHQAADAASVPRLLVLAAALALVATAPARAVVTVSTDASGVASVPMDPSEWTNYSSTCVTAGGTGCTLTGRPDSANSDLLFSWGTQGSFDTPGLNSVLEVTYTGPGMTLGSITFNSDPTGEKLGPLPNPNPGIPQIPGATPFPLDYSNNYQGFGTMVAYENDTLQSWRLLDAAVQTNAHLITDQRMDIRVTRSGSQIEIVRGWLVADDLDQIGPGIDPTSKDYTDGTFGNWGMAQYPIDQTYSFTGSRNASDDDAQLRALPINTGDIVEFLFYESDWNNQNPAPGEDGLPDAYYGDFTVTLNEGELLEMDEVDFGNVRAGTTSTLAAAARTMTATNRSFQAMTDVQFQDISSAPEGLTPTTAGSPSTVASGATSQREYSYTAPDLELDDTSAASFSAEQTLDAKVDFGAGAQDVTAAGNVTGTVVGPVLGVADEDAPASYLEYNSTINLGVDLASAQTDLMTLLLSNIFDAGLEDFGTLDDLTLYNAGITNIIGSAFSIQNSGNFGEDLNRKADSLVSFSNLELLFSPGSVGFFTGTLFFTTDMNQELATTAAPTNVLVFNLLGTAIDSGQGSTPLPGSLLLIATGLLGLRVFGAVRRRGAGPGSLVGARRGSH